MRIQFLIGSLTVFCTVAMPVPARAELVFFANGQSISVKTHRIDGDALVLSLRNGGELACDPSVVVRIAPDEVPYPEPADERAEVTAPVAAPSIENGRIDIETGPYGAVIDKVAAEQGVSAKLVRAVISVESAGQPQARSSKGAVGLMQLMPQTARQYTANDPYDPETNIEAGIKHLRALLDRFPLALALAAYNAGEAAVQRFGGIPPYPETQRYVSRILQLVNP